ncbi:MAG: PEGA domain-containing protein [Acidobacteria bacterium]|nr:PEGA domain-containing protein [Acidobacteriota bacterium]
MSKLKRSTTWACIAAALLLFSWPTEVDAQGRAVRRAPGSGPVLRTSARYGPGDRYRPYAYGSSYRYRPYLYGAYGYGAYGYGPYGYGGWGGYPYYGGYVGYDRGSVRLQVKPEATEVYIDGYYAGVVDSYDGFFQRLHLPAGEHDIQLRLEGFRSIQEQMYLTEGSTYRIEHIMEPLGPGETTAPPPTPPAEPPSPAGQVEPAPFTGGPAGAGALDTGDFGRLAIRVQPTDAVILVNGEEWRSPDAARLELDLGPGQHRIEVSREGYERYITDVQVRPGETTAVNVSLPRRREEEQ